MNDVEEATSGTVKVRTLASYERGVRSVSERSLEALARAYDTTVLDLREQALASG